MMMPVGTVFANREAVQLGRWRYRRRMSAADVFWERGPAHEGVDVVSVSSTSGKQELVLGSFDSKLP